MQGITPTGPRSLRPSGTPARWRPYVAGPAMVVVLVAAVVAVLAVVVAVLAVVVSSSPFPSPSGGAFFRAHV